MQNKRGWGSQVCPLLLYSEKSMKNNTNYFSHDCNAREDEKILQLRSKYWREGYWIWWLIVEKLSEATSYKLLVSNKSVISHLYLANMEVINYLFEIWLLVEYEWYFTSPSLLDRMEMKKWIKKAQSEWWKKAMRKRRWEQGSDKSLITSKVKQSKVKQSKVKEINNKDNTIVLEQAPTYWNKDINDVLEKIKMYNNWIVDWTVKEQRQYWKMLLTKINKIESVENWKYKPADLLEIILKIISKNEYHSHKIVWPKKIYYDLAWLMQVCKQEIQKEDKGKIPFIPWI